MTQSVFAGYEEKFGQPLFDAAELATLEDVRRFVEAAYRRPTTPLQCLQRAASGASVRLPAAVAEPSRLIAHAVGIAGDEGLSMARLREVFAAVGHERFRRGLELAQVRGSVHSRREARPNRAGRCQQQIVLRPGPPSLHPRSRAA